MKSGPKPKGKVVIKWNSKFAYAIGLLVADGCLSKDGRHMSLTSIDKEQILTFKSCLALTTKVARKFSGSGSMAYHTQFGDVLFYKFLMKIGLSSAKSKTISEILIPRRYFFDFLRGYFDGDGCSYSYYDPIYPKSYRFYISFASGSEKYVDWLRSKLQEYAQIKGHIDYRKNSTNLQLKYAKKEAMIIAKKMYYRKGLVSLERKKLKINKALRIIDLRRSGEIGRHATFRTL